jgi:hypothetical protein
VQEVSTVVARVDHPRNSHLKQTNTEALSYLSRGWAFVG